MKEESLMTKFNTIEKWRDEYRTMEACKEAFEKGVSPAFYNQKLKTFISSLVQSFGIDRVKTVFQ